MDLDCYRVEVLHFLDPHLIWVELNKNGDITFEQIGLYGILPVEPSIQLDGKITCKISEKWVPAVKNTMEEFFKTPDELWFFPTLIDRRTSVFDNNIHKFGKLVIKKDSCENSLSKLICQSGFGLYDLSHFHQSLSSGGIKTKLSHTETIKVIEYIVSYYNDLNLPTNKWKSSLENQTTIFNTSLQLEALTVKNLERHNSNLSQITLLQEKLRDLSMCKDVDEPSMGRASKKSKANSSKCSSILDRKLKLYINGKKLSANDPMEVLQSAKQFIEKHAVHINTSETKSSLSNTYDNNREKENVSRINDINRVNVEHKEDKNIDIFKEDSKGEGTRRNVDILKLSSINCYTEKRTEVPCRSNCNILKEPGVCTSILEDVDTHIIKKDRKGKSCSPSNGVLVAFGPPGYDRTKLPRKMLSIISKQIDSRVRNNEEDDIVDRNILDDEKDSEVNFDLSNSKVEVIANNTNKSSNNTDKKNTSGETSPNVTTKNKSCASLLRRKLKQYKPFNFNAQDIAFTTDADTNNKDIAIIDNSKAIDSVESDSFDDSDNISDIVKELNLQQQQIIPNCSSRVEINPNYSEINANPFRNVDGSRSIFVDKLVSPILMVHTKRNNRIQPYSNLRDVPFGSEILSALGNMSIKGPTRIQSVSWNTILRGYSLFMIGSVDCGKTMGYLPAVCRLLSDYHANKYTAGPSSIIVCGTAQSMSEVEKVSRMLLGLEVKVVACHVGMDELDLTMNLLNGCDLLICMPSFLVRLLHNKDFGVDLRSLRTFVIDDCERVFDVYAKEMKFAIYNVKEMLKSRANKEMKVQFVAASRKWCNSLSTLVKTAPDSVICIGAFQECVLYSRTNTTVSFVKNDNKINEVIDFLQGVDGAKKAVIVCRSDDEVKYLESSLTDKKYIVFACDNTMTLQDLYNINISWGSYEEPTLGPILICCDENLSHMNVTDAYYLVHYSMPSLFSTFCRRFSVLNDNYPSIFKSDRKLVKIKVLLEERNVEQLPKILNFVKRCSANVPDVLDVYAKDILLKKDLVKATKFVPLCDSYLTLGICQDFWNCQERHSLFKDYDTPKEWVPINGEVTLKLLHYHTAVSFSARLLSNTINGETRKFPQTHSTLSLKMGMYFSKESNKKFHGVPNVGDVCAVAIKQNLYVRCQVIKLLSHNKNGKPNHVLIKLIDEEKLEKTRDIYLYHLPDDLRNIETYVVNVRLSNVKPLDRDVTFSEIVKNHLKKITDDNDELFMRGRIALTVGNCVFVDTLEACQDLCSFNEIVVRHNFKRELLAAHALVNDKHMDIIKDHCKQANITVPEVTVIEKGSDQIVTAKTLPKGDWAFLDGEELSPVYLSYAESPDKFFLRHLKFESCMSSLLNDINVYVKENSNQVTEIKKGDIILAKFPDDERYERARIDGIIDDNIVECFFVDQGDWHKVPKKHIRHITERIIQQLPYQAMECRLVGIKPPGTIWPEYSNNWFCDNCFEDNRGNMKQLFVRLCTKELAEYTEGHKYGVVIIDTNSDKDVVVNLMLIGLNLARINENEIDYLHRNTTDSISNNNNVDEQCNEKEILSLININKTNDDEIAAGESSANPVYKSKFDFTADDEDILENDFEMNIDDNMVGLFKTSVPNWLATEVKANYPSIITSDGKVIRTDNDQMGIVSKNNLPAIEDISKNLPVTNETTNDSLSSENRDQINITELSPNTNPFRRPKLLWRQTTTSVFIKIMLIGLENYDLEIKEKSIIFSALNNDTDYCFEIELYGVVDNKTSTHSNKGQYVLIKMVKLLKRNWLDLTRDSENKKWIEYDVDSLDASSDEEESRDNTLMEVFKQMHEKVESESEDDDFRDDTKFSYS